MKKALLLLFVIMFYQTGTGSSMPLPVKSIKIEIVPIIKEYTLDVLTIYNPVEAQTDSLPLLTASMRTINKERLLAGKLRWMALSRDLLTRFKGDIAYGDTITIHSADRVIAGSWVVVDTMNKKYSRRGDLMFHENVRHLGLWRNVKFTKNEGC